MFGIDFIYFLGGPMVIEISIAVAVLLFAVLVFFIARTLIATQQCLYRVQQMTLDMENRMKSFDPILHTITNLGEICERESERIKSAYLIKKANCVSREPGLSCEVIDWIVLSVKLGEKLINNANFR
jgi:uncharacterized protein YoxC